MMIDSVDSLLIALIALLPGFVALTAYKTVIPRQAASGVELSLESLAFGVINACLHAWWLIPLLGNSATEIAESARNSRWTTAIAALAYCLATPVAIGYVAALARRHITLPGMLNPAPTGWDHFFRAEPSVVVYATLRDGTRIAGLYTRETGGFASSFPQPQSIYCGQLFPLDEDGLITGPPPTSSRGVLLQAEECVSIEFLEIPSLDADNLFNEVEHVVEPEIQP